MFRPSSTTWPELDLRYTSDLPPSAKARETGSYYDWDADLKEDEFRALHEHFRPLSETGLYGFDAWQKRIRPQMQIIEAALAARLGTLGKIQVTVFEWESGL